MADDEAKPLMGSRKESQFSYQSNISPTDVQDADQIQQETPRSASEAALTVKYQHRPHRYPHQIEFEKDDDDDEAANKKKKKKKKTLKSLWSQVDQAALQFGFRMAILLTISSLFVLIRSDTSHYPDGMWVLVSVLFVSWFPSLEAASVVEKILQRLIGTFVGAFLGLGCGFTSLLFYNSRFHQSMFLGICMFIFNFLIIFLAGQCKVGPLKVIRRFAYATILCVLTFCICMLPFSLDSDPKWETGVWRVINVIVGCVLGALGAIAICPKSTTDVLLQKTSRQVQLAGEASEAVLHTASDFFAGRIHVNRLADELLTSPLESTIKWKLMRSTSSLSSDSDGLAKADVALKKYEDAIGDWRVTKMLFPLTHYDPFSIPINESTGRAKRAQTEIARTLARALRIQTTIVVLDGMIRSDAEYVFTQEQLALFSEAGNLIKDMLKVANSGGKAVLYDRIVNSDVAAKQLFINLELIRRDIRKVSMAVSSSDVEVTIGTGGDREQGIKDFKSDLLGNVNSGIFLSSRTREEDEDMGRGVPKNATDRNDNSLFFLQLVEHLILRSLRLYQAWKHVEMDQLNDR